MERATRGLRAAAITGGVMVLIALIMTRFYPLQMDHLPEGFVSPILAVEFLASHADARHLFAEDQDLIRQFQIGHRIDMLFLVSYSLFLALPHWAFWLRRRHWTSLAGLLACAIAGLADASENWQLLQMGNALLGTDAPPDYGLLRLYTGTKFLAITIAMLCLARSLFLYGYLGKLFAALSLILVPVTMLALEGNPPLIESMALVTMLAWIVLLIWLVRMRNGFPAR